MTFRRVYIIFLCCGAVFIMPRVQAAVLPTSVTVVVIPNAPSDLTAVPDAPTQVTLSWTDNSNGAEDGFSIERKIGVGGTYSVIATTGSGIATYVDNGASADTTYFYRVRAFTGSEYSDYSNEASVTTPSGSGNNGSGTGGNGGGEGGGGGGGGGFLPPSTPQVSAIFKGLAYPTSNVSLLENGQLVAVTEAGPDAKFEVDLSNVASGTYTFGLWAEDPDGNRSLTQTFTVTLTPGATTIISGIFFAPTISLSEAEVKQGDPLTVLGYSAPQATVSVIVNSTNEIMGNVTSSDDGSWAYQVNTNLLEYGQHTVHANAEASDGSLTTNSNFVAFTVGDETVAAPTTVAVPPQYDLNSDGRINLVDFSILAYWYGKPNPPAAVLFDNASEVDLTDFSILAYYWTG
jgi:hypothetical protein